MQSLNGRFKKLKGGLLRCGRSSNISETICIQYVRMQLYLMGRDGEGLWRGTARDGGERLCYNVVVENAHDDGR